MTKMTPLDVSALWVKEPYLSHLVRVQESHNLSTQDLFDLREPYLTHVAQNHSDIYHRYGKTNLSIKKKNANKKLERGFFLGLRLYSMR
jgi:hypothetical protein